MRTKALKGRIPSDGVCLINFLMFELMANKMTNTNLSPFTMLKIKTQVGGVGLSPLHKAQE